VETITHYLEKYARDIIAKKKAAAPPGCPLPSGSRGQGRLVDKRSP
jgi:hypothetical protein